jgi:hypothetical protein
MSIGRLNSGHAAEQDVKISAFQPILAVATGVTILFLSFPAEALGPPPMMPRMNAIRIDMVRPGDVPGAPRSLGSPKEQYMLAPAQPGPPPKKKKRN